MTLTQARDFTAAVGLFSFACWLWLTLLTLAQLGLRLPPLG
jgi:hypothetical protein